MHPSTARFGLITAFYAVTLFASSIASFGVLIGSIFAAGVLGLWLVVYSSPSPSLAVSRLALYLLLPAFLVLLLLPAKSGVTESGRRLACLHNVQQLSWALLLYETEHGSFPPACVADETGKPMHSWRVLILPYIEQQDLYEQYDFDEPWDGPNNLKLLNRCPDIFRCPSSDLPNSHTTYVAVVGPETIWSGEKATKLKDIVDGLDETILIVESPKATAWTKPTDISIDEFVNAFAKRNHNSFFVHHIDNLFTEGRAISAARADGSSSESTMG